MKDKMKDKINISYNPNNINPNNIKLPNKFKEILINNESNNYTFFDETYNIELFSVFKEFINDCFGTEQKYDIKTLKNKYDKILFFC